MLLRWEDDPMPKDNYALSEESQTKIGLNEDLSPNEDFEEPEEEQDTGKMEPINIGDIEKEEEKPAPKDADKSDDKTKEGEIDGDKDKDEEKEPEKDSPPKPGKDDDKEGDNKDKDESEDDVESDETNDKDDDEPDFNTKVIEHLSKFDDATKDQFIVDLEQGLGKFTAASTQRSQEAADQLKKANQLFDLIGGDKVKEALKDDGLMEALDEWFDPEFKDGEKADKSKNPFRVIELKDVEHYSKEQILLEKSKNDLALDREILEVQRLDKKFEDAEELKSLAEYADEAGTTLAVAAKMKISEQKDKDQTKEIETLKTQLKDTKKELKTRNDEYQKLEKSAAPILTPGADGVMGVEKVDFKSSEDETMDQREARVRKKLGVD
jgi:hypothetical protein